jgi:hypothetical protein
MASIEILNPLSQGNLLLIKPLRTSLACGNGLNKTRKPSDFTYTKKERKKVRKMKDKQIKLIRKRDKLTKMEKEQAKS